MSASLSAWMNCFIDVYPGLEYGRAPASDSAGLLARVPASAGRRRCGRPGRPRSRTCWVGDTVPSPPLVSVWRGLMFWIAWAMPCSVGSPASVRPAGRLLQRDGRGWLPPVLRQRVLCQSARRRAAGVRRGGRAFRSYRGGGGAPSASIWRSAGRRLVPVVVRVSAATSPYSARPGRPGAAVSVPGVHVAPVRRWPGRGRADGLRSARRSAGSVGQYRASVPPSRGRPDRADADRPADRHGWVWAPLAGGADGGCPPRGLPLARRP